MCTKLSAIEKSPTLKRSLLTDWQWLSIWEVAPWDCHSLFCQGVRECKRHARFCLIFWSTDPPLQCLIQPHRSPEKTPLWSQTPGQQPTVRWSRQQPCTLRGRRAAEVKQEEICFFGQDIYFPKGPGWKWCSKVHFAPYHRCDFMKVFGHLPNLDSLVTWCCGDKLNQ